MQALLSSGEDRAFIPSFVAENAYMMADAMLAERGKRGGRVIMSEEDIFDKLIQDEPYDVLAADSPELLEALELTKAAITYFSNLDLEIKQELQRRKPRGVKWLNG